ncbi:MAG: hypothetical protein L6R38_003074 [Xanthoria sp. 2 TBL-2021]|nr:MAG: hypothetical protein L6R38_003074 [Xanthoria sp. 2 TBL-2021]
MVNTHIALEVPYIVCYEPGEQPPENIWFEDLAEHWPADNSDEMANEDFEHGYYHHHPSMQRFLEAAGPFSADRPIIDQKQPQFSGKSQEAIALDEYYGSPNPWPHNINTAHDPCPQESWSSEWTSLDQESCSGATGNTWSPQPTESCSDGEPRYSSFTAPQPYIGGYSYSSYASCLTQVAGATSPHSPTGALREIQQIPDTETQNGSMPPMQGEMHGADRIYPAIAARLETGTASFNRDEALGSSLNGSAITSPNTEDEIAAMDSVNGDSDNGSDYSPQGRTKRIPRNKGAPNNPRSQGSVSPTARRLSSTKSKPHQLTQPAKISKRPSSASKTSIPTRSLPSSQVRNPAHTVRCTYSHCSQTFSSTSVLSKHVLSVHTRPFACSFARYGCNSTFGAKNEWKRHVSSIHLSLGIYRCDVGASCAPHPGPRSRHNNNFSSSHQPPNPQQQGGCGYKSNRKDLFTQHLQRMHRPAASAPHAEREHFDKSLEEVRQRCWVSLRGAPPRSSCGYCAPHPSRQTSTSGSELHEIHDMNHHQSKKHSKPAIFTGPGSWEERMEHVGRHLEKGPVGTEVEDLQLRDWMLAEGLLEQVKGEYRVVGVGGKKRGRGAYTGTVKDEEGAIVEGGEEDADGEDE